MDLNQLKRKYRYNSELEIKNQSEFQFLRKHRLQIWGSSAYNEESETRFHREKV